MNAYIFPGLSFNQQALIRQPIEAVRCGKKNCFFCDRIFGVPIQIKPKRKYQYLKKHLWTNTRWTNEEKEILLLNINSGTENLLKLLPGRRWYAVNVKASEMRKEYNIKPKPRKDLGYERHEKIK
jgi:hypothetical protein